ncbi:MAG: signal peptidase I [Planctomycetota bacterium]|jgi:signal peptidase I
MSVDMTCQALEDIQRNKEPWFGVNISWLIPGCGHLYLGRYVRCAVFVVLVGFLNALWVGSLTSVKCWIILSLGIKLATLIVLPAVACVDVFKIAKKANPDEFEARRLLSKDPWLAVFLSVLLPGLGHLYIRKGFFFVLYLCVFLPVKIEVIRTHNPLLFVGFCLFRVLTCVHAYGASPIHNEQRKTKIIIFAIVFMAVQHLTGALGPIVRARYIVINTNLAGSSMEPTIKENDAILISRLTYIWNSPQVGHIVATKELESGDFACKRVVAVGGETVQVKNGNVYVNGRERTFNVSQSLDEGRKQMGAASNIGGMDSSYLRFGVDQPYRVPVGYYFLLGDNIQFSADSRYYGAVKKDDIIGRVVKIYWPPQRIGTLD